MGANNWRSTAYVYICTDWCLNYAAKFSPTVCWTNHSTGFPNAGIRLTATNGTAHTKTQGQMLFVTCFMGAGGLNFSSSSHKSGWFRNSSRNCRTKGDKWSPIVQKKLSRKGRMTFIPLGRHQAGTVPFCQECRIVTSTTCNRGPEKQGHEKHKLLEFLGQQAPSILLHEDHSSYSSSSVRENRSNYIFVRLPLSPIKYLNCQLPSIEKKSKNYSCKLTVKSIIQM